MPERRAGRSFLLKSQVSVEHIPHPNRLHTVAHGSELLAEGVPEVGVASWKHLCAVSEWLGCLVRELLLPEPVVPMTTRPPVPTSLRESLPTANRPVSSFEFSSCACSSKMRLASATNPNLLV